MAPCCPPGRGCNASAGDEPCVLALCVAKAAEEPDAALAIARWTAWKQACAPPQSSKQEPRFRRRSYERARDRALAALLMREQPRPAGRTRRLGIPTRLGRGRVDLPRRPGRGRAGRTPLDLRRGRR